MEATSVLKNKKEERRNLNRNHLINFDDLINDDLSIKEEIDQTIEPILPEGIAYYATKTK